MKNENHPKFLGLVGKKVARVHMSNSHGEEVMIDFTDGTELRICSYHGTRMEKEHHPDELYVGVADSKGVNRDFEEL